MLLPGDPECECGRCGYQVVDRNSPDESQKDHHPRVPRLQRSIVVGNDLGTAKSALHLVRARATATHLGCFLETCGIYLLPCRMGVGQVPPLLEHIALRTKRTGPGFGEVVFA